MKRGREVFLTVVALTALAGQATAYGASPPAPLSVTPAAVIRFMIPNSASGELDTGLATLIEEYNQTRRAQGSATVRLVRRGDSFSSLKDLIALHLAGDAPEIAAIEVSELPALSRAHLALPIPASLVTRLKLTPGKRLESIPFQHSVPVLIADQEVLFRAHADRRPLPSSWGGLLELVQALAGPTSMTSPAEALALPLQGPRGLWIFEALAGRPLWTHEAGGLKTNRDLEPVIQKIQNLGLPETTWERAIEHFLDRKSPLLVTSLDTLPLIARKASFRWKAALLPGMDSADSTQTPHRRPHKGPHALLSGSDLIVTRDSADVWSFLNFLYSKEAAGRWAIAAGFLPLASDWRDTPEWKTAPEAYRTLALLALPQSPSSAPARSTDPDVVRAHTEWVTALHYLFGEPSRRLPSETVFTQLDSTLTQK